jgi:hypothetical protein
MRLEAIPICGHGWIGIVFGGSASLVELSTYSGASRLKEAVWISVVCWNMGGCGSRGGAAGAGSSRQRRTESESRI